MGLGVGLHGMGDVAHPVADLALGDALQERLLGDTQQLTRLFGDLSHRESRRRVGDVAVHGDAHVDAQDVAFVQADLARDAVHHHVVGRRADGPGKPR